MGAVSVAVLREVVIPDNVDDDFLGTPHRVAESDARRSGI
jgi:hypothetical protein